VTRTHPKGAWGLRRRMQAPPRRGPAPSRHPTRQGWRRWRVCVRRAQRLARVASARERLGEVSIGSSCWRGWGRPNRRAMVRGSGASQPTCDAVPPSRGRCGAVRGGGWSHRPTGLPPFGH